MKPLLSLTAFLISISSFSQSESLLSQLYSGKGVQIIEPGNISTKMGEYSPFFDINHNELYFMRRTPGLFDYTIYKSKLTAKGWSNPEVASFSGTYRDAAPYLSPNGTTIYYDSKRPSNKVANNSINIWTSTRKNNRWSEPKLVEAASVNTQNEPKAGLDEYGPAVDAQGNLYFYSFRKPYRGGTHYQVLPPDYKRLQINKELPDPSYNTFVSYLYISPNGHFVLLEGRDTRGRKTDIFYSCKNDANQWKEPKRVSLINTAFGEGVPSMTADGQFLLFASSRTTKSSNASNANLYIVETKGLFGKCQKSFFE
jgi:hypothetical protein